MEFFNPQPPKGSDGESLQISPGDAKSLPEIRDNNDAGGGGHVKDSDLNDPSLQYSIWSSDTKS